MKHALSALALAAACALPAPVFAQAKPTEIYVSVVDGKGDPAPGLTAEEFRVREDGVAREVLKAGPATEPLTVALLVDDSQATSPGDPDDPRGGGHLHHGARRQGGNRARDVRRPADHRRSTTRPIRRSCSTARSASSRARRRRQPAGRHRRSQQGLQKREPARPVIAVLMMDDAVEFSNRYYDKVLRRARRSGGAALHVVALGQPGNSLSDELRNRNQVGRARHRADRRTPRQRAGADGGRAEDEAARRTSC